MDTEVTKMGLGYQNRARENDVMLDESNEFMTAHSILSGVLGSFRSLRDENFCERLVVGALFNH